MADNLRVTRVGTRKVTNRIQLIAKRSANVTPVWPKVGSFITRSNRRQFLSRGAHYKTPWRPLKRDYMLWKLRHGYGRKTLVLTGKMKASFTTRPMSIERYYKKSAVFGSNNRLSIFHQYGTFRNGRPVIPARPIQVATPHVRSTISQMIAHYVLHGKAPYVKDYPL